MKLRWLSLEEWLTRNQQVGGSNPPRGFQFLYILILKMKWKYMLIRRKEAF